MVEPCVWEPDTYYMTGQESGFPYCDNCLCQKGEHCLNTDCRVCPGEYHICVEFEGKLME